MIAQRVKFHGHAHEVELMEGGNIGAFGKFMLVGTVVTAISYAMTWLLRMIPGAKRIL